MPHIIVRQPGKMPVSIPLRDGLRAGRQEQNDIVLDDSQASRQHAVFAKTAAGWEIRDLGSRHGTRVAGEPVTVCKLESGDLIQIGSTLLELREEDEREIIHHQTTDAAPPPRVDGADRRLGLLYDVSRAISDLGDTAALLERMLEVILDVLGAERALVALADELGGVRRRFERAPPGSAGEVILSRTVVEATLARREAVIISDARREAAPLTMMREHVLSAMAAPLVVGGAATGLLYVDDRRASGRFGPADLEFLIALGHLIAAALHSAERYQRAEIMADLSAQAEGDLIGQSAAMRALKTQIAKYAAAGHAHVLVRGSSGAGKELVASALHKASPRSNRPFVTLNCAAIPDTMLESELFGYDKGAFTGAVKAKRGKFALADGGTLFLDEIGDLALPAQAKVLRAIQEGEIQPLGSEQSARVDVRVVAATHKDLVAEIAAKRFREDLYYRLAVIEVVVPPLAEREGDVALLAHAFLQRACGVMGKKLDGFTEVAMAALERHTWPGNVRELRNEIERAVIHADGPLVDAHDLSPRLGAARPALGTPGRGLAERYAELEPTEKQLVEEAIGLAKGNLSEAARLLGITRIMIKRRADKFGLAGKDD